MPPSSGRTLAIRLYNSECQNLRNIPATLRFRNNGRLRPKRIVDFATGREVLPLPDVHQRLECIVNTDRHV